MKVFIIGVARASNCVSGMPSMSSMLRRIETVL